MGGDAYRGEADNLTQWAWCHMVNRTDRYVYYRSRSPATSIKRPLTKDRLLRHFRAVNRSGIVSLHSASKRSGQFSTSRWVCFDVDCHGGDDASKSMKTAMILTETMESMGLPPLALSSNGIGGVHLYLIFDQPIFCHHAWALCDLVLRCSNVVCEYAPHSQWIDRDNIMAKAMRLFGRHHSRDFWSLAMEGGMMLDENETVRRILSYDCIKKEAIPHEVFARGDAVIRAKPRRRFAVQTNVVSNTTLTYLRGDVTNGQRNRMLFASACDLQARGRSFDNALSILLKPSLSMGLSESEVRGTIRSAYKKDRLPGRASYVNWRDISSIAKRVNS